MADALPAPFVPPEVDLRDYEFMPFYGKRLFESDTWALCNDAEKLVALRLWWASWHQEPSGSLPDNDRLLCSAAGKGDVLAAFQKVKANAMRGWIKCSDGRFYHPVVAEIALDVWKTKRKKETDNAADRERKRRKRAGIPADTTPVSGGLSAGNPAENALKEKVKEKTKGNGGSSSPEVLGSPRAPEADDDLAIPPFLRAKTLHPQALKALGDAVDASPGWLVFAPLTELLEAGATEADVLDACRAAAEQKTAHPLRSWSYVATIVETNRTRKAAHVEADKAQSNGSAERVKAVVARLSREPEQNLGRGPG
jgi:hypothetical protein